MTWSTVQTAVASADNNGSPSGTSVAVSFGSTISANSVVSGLVMWENDIPANLTSVTNDKGDTAIIVDTNQDASNGEGGGSYVFLNPTSGAQTITANFDATTTFFRIAAKEDTFGAGFTYAVDGHNTLFQSPAGSTGANILNTGAFTTAANGDLINAFFGNTGGAPTFTAGTSPNAFTSRFNNSGNPTVLGILLEDFVQTTAASITPTAGIFIGTAGDKLVAFGFAIKATAGGGGTLVTGWQNNARDVYSAAPQKLSAAPAFISTFRTAGISGSAWNAQRDHAKLPPSVVFSTPPAYGHAAFGAASTIAGMSWFEPWDQIKAKKVNLESLPAFVSTFRTAAISGMAWFTARDLDVPSKGKFLTDPVTVTYAPATITWSFQVGDTTFIREAPVDIPPAFGRAITQPVGISGVAWFTPFDWAKPKVSFSIPSAYAVNVAPVTNTNVGIPWFEPWDQFKAKQVNLESFPAMDPRPPQVQISGIAWHAPRDIDALPKGKFLSDPAAIAYVPTTVTFGFLTVAENLFRFKLPTDAPPAFGQSVLSQTVGISGIGWFEPPDIVRPSLRINGEAQPAISLTPATLPPKIAGMAWFEPPDRDRAPVRVTFDYAPAFGRSLTAPVNTISGMAWFEAPDRDRQSTRVNLDAPPAFGNRPFVVTGMGWFQPPDRFNPARAIRDEIAAQVYGASLARVAFGWFVPTDWRAPNVRIYSVAPASVLVKPPPPVGISGMAWFAPADHDKTPFRAIIEMMPAWSASIIIQTSPSGTPFRLLDIHGAMPPEEFGADAASGAKPISISSIDGSVTVSPPYRRLTDKGALN